MRDRGVTGFRALVLVTACAAAGIALVIACLVRMGSPRHLLGMVSELCMTAGHIASEAVSLALAILVVTTVGLAFAVAVSTALRTRRFIASLVRTDRAHPDVVGAARRAGLAANVVVVRDERMLAFTTGLARPMVVISTQTVDSLCDDELVAVLAHEAHHVRRRDPLKLFVARVASVALFWLPVVRDLRHSYEIGAEVAADVAAQQRLGCKKALVRAVLGFAERPPHMAIAHFATANVEDVRLRCLASSERALPRMASMRSLTVSGLSTMAIYALVVAHLSLPSM